jgi:hypothetical protein
MKMVKIIDDDESEHDKWKIMKVKVICDDELMMMKMNMLNGRL